MIRRLSDEQLFKVGPNGLEPLDSAELDALLDAQPVTSRPREPFKWELEEQAS